jgi:hypothetical protein
VSHTGAYCRIHRPAVLFAAPADRVGADEQHSFDAGEGRFQRIGIVEVCSANDRSSCAEVRKRFRASCCRDDSARV